MSRYVLLAAAATIMHGVAFAQTPTAAAPVAAPAPPAIAAQGTPTTPPPPPSGRPSMPVPQAPAVAPTAPTPPTPPRAIAQSFPATPTNVRLELVLTDTYSGSPVKKTVSMLVVHRRHSGMVSLEQRPVRRELGPDGLIVPVHPNQLVAELGVDPIRARFRVGGHGGRKAIRSR